MLILPYLLLARNWINRVILEATCINIGSLSQKYTHFRSTFDPRPVLDMLFSYLSLQPNKMAFTENWKYTISRMEDTKSYLFKRYITNILKYNNILSEYETSFRSELRTALSGKDPRTVLASWSAWMRIGTVIRTGQSGLWSHDFRNDIRSLFVYIYIEGFLYHL